MANKEVERNRGLQALSVRVIVMDLLLQKRMKHMVLE